MLQTLRYATRQLRKAPGFALTAVMTLALGIGATIAVFSIVDAVLLRPLPFPSSEKLVAVDTLRGNPHAGKGVSSAEPDTSYPNFYDWRSMAKSFSAMAAYKTDGYTLADRAGGPAQRVVGVNATSDLFTTLGVKPLLGTGFRRDEEQAGNRSIVIGNALWQSQFGGANDVLGRTVRLNDEDYTVIGVMDKGFQFPIDATEALFWTTQAHDAEGKNSSASQRGWNQVQVVGRLRDGVTLAHAQAEMNAIQGRLAAQYPDDLLNDKATALAPLAQELVGDVSQPLRILLASVTFLLLIACANVAGLLLTRASVRSGEMSIRAALGASRSQIVRQVLTECTVLAMAGGGLGLGLAALVLRLAPAYLPANLPRVSEIAIHPGIALFSLGLSLLTGLVFGALPAWRMSRLDPATTMRGGARAATAGRGQQRIQRVLVVAETAVGLTLLVGAGLMLRSFDRILHVDPGFRPDHVFTFRIGMPPKRYSDEQRTAFFDRLMPQLQSLPGVQAASGAFPLPLTGGNISITFSIVGQKTAPGDEPAERLSIVQRNFFATLGIPLMQGRYFDDSDHRATAHPTIVINEAFARRYFPGENPLGRQIETDVGISDTPPIREVVGVVGNVKRVSLTEQSKPEYYIPIEQAPLAPPAIAMRVAGDPAAYENQVRAVVARMDSSLPVYRVRTYSQEMARVTAQQRFEAMLLTSFAAVALVLSAVGLYGLLSYMVAQRTREIGLRMALGAQRSMVRNQVLRQGMGLCVLGLGIGGALAALLTRFIASLLFGVGRFDLLTFAGMSLLLLGVSCLASLAPAWRASSIEPMQALRAE